MYPNYSIVEAEEAVLRLSRGNTSLDAILYAYIEIFLDYLDNHLKELLVLEVEDSLLADREGLLGELHGELPG
jgi:hypothetical protein